VDVNNLEAGTSPAVPPEAGAARWTWRCRDRKLDLSVQGEIVGILNVTPDSFSDGGRFADPDRAVAHGLALRAEGARILDIGGESTRPGAAPVPESVERERVLPVVARLRAADPDVFLSVDTSKAPVARAALEAGADIVNDVTALRGDPDMAGVVAEFGAGVVLMHMQGSPLTMQLHPAYADVVGEVEDFFRERMASARTFGIAEDRVVLDPGIGFGKDLAHNLELLRQLARLGGGGGRPLMLGISRKSLFQRLLGAGLEDRTVLTAAGTALARQAGVRLHRVHDVRENFRALRLAEAWISLGDGDS
jgi:dihydropteroate synthase